MIIVVHSVHDEGSRAFVDALPSGVYPIINFYQDFESTERLNFDALQIGISGFPTVVDTTKMLTVLKPVDMAEAIAYFDAN